MTSATQIRTDFFLADATVTDAFGRWMAPVLTAGSVILLSGGIGAGKTQFARAVVRARLGPQTEVPSPTFTLVQPYDDRGLAILHADLYRLTHPDEVQELGLDEAAQRGIVLIEWPDRLAPDHYPDALHLTFMPLAEGRHVTAQGNHRLMARVTDFATSRGRHG